MKTLKVVAAIIFDDEGRVFATEKGYGSFKGKWEFPGGKIKNGESPEKALKREIREELNIEITVGKLFTIVDYDYDNFHLHMTCYCCTISSGNIKLNEHKNARFLEVRDLDLVDWLPADVEVVKRIKDIR